MVNICKLIIIILCMYVSGDSGGPALQWIGNRWEQVGIASYVDGFCGSDGSRVGYFRDWIQTQMIENENINVYKCIGVYEMCGCSRQNVVLSSSTIVESEYALPHTWSMIVSISLRSNNQHLCSGTILENSFILTAAHCVRYRSANDLIIKAGMYSLSESNDDIIVRRVNGIFLHPNYTNHVNDLAILRLSSPLDAYEDKNISRSCLPSEDNPSILNGTQLVITGWNINNKPLKSPYSFILKQAEIYTVDNCSALNGEDDSQFCVGQYRRDQEHVLSSTCFGGSFADPVFQWIGYRWLQVGIASHCSMNNKRGVVTNLTKHTDWIQSTMIASTLQTSQVYQCDRKASCGCSQADVNITTFGVVKSDTAVENSWSMVVSIQWLNTHRCTGSILSDSFIITAATCVGSFVNRTNMNQMISIVAGISKLNDTNEIVRTIDRIYIHPNFSDSYFNLHNIAILQLNQSLPFSPTQTIISKTCVSMKNETSPTTNTSLVIVGWDDHLLQQMSVRSLNPTDLSCLYQSIDENYQFCITSSTNDKFPMLTDLCDGIDFHKKKCIIIIFVMFK